MDEQKLKEKLNPEQYRIMREGGMEMPYISKYWDHKESGIYFCAACGNKLFSSLAKFNSGEGWPAFRNPTSEKDIEVRANAKGVMEVLCRKCKSHLGEVVGGKENTYYRVNSVCLDFQPVGIEFEEEKEGSKESGGGKETDKKKEKEGVESKSLTQKTVSFVVGGVVVGVLAGVGLGMAFCQTGEVNFKSDSAEMPSTVLVQPISVVEPTPAVENNPTLSRPPTVPSTSTGAVTNTATIPRSPASEQPRNTTTVSTESGAPDGSMPPSGTAVEQDQAGSAVPVGGGAPSGGQ